MTVFSKRASRNCIIVAAILGLGILATACSQTNTSSGSAAMDHGTMDGMGHAAAPVAMTQATGGRSDSHSQSEETAPALGIDHGAMDDMGHATAPVAVTQTTGGHSDSHGLTQETASASVPDKGLILGGFGAVNGIVIALAAILKIRTPKKKRAGDAIQKNSSTGGLGK